MSGPETDFTVIGMIPVFSSLLRKKKIILQVLFQKLKVFLTAAVMYQPGPATQPGCNSQERVTAPCPYLDGSSKVASSLLSLRELCKALGHPCLLNNFLLKVRQALKKRHGLSVEVFIKRIFSCSKLNQNLTGDAIFILKFIHVQEQL